MHIRIYLLDSVNTDVHIEQTRSGRVDCMSPDISIEYKVDSNSRKYKKEPQYTDKKKISEKENIVSYSNFKKPTTQKPKYIKPLEKSEKRPNWNISKPCKRFVPASERYPRCLQKQREEKKARRQMELLQQVERNSPGNLCQKKSISPDLSPSPHHEDNVNAVRKVMSYDFKVIALILVHMNKFIIALYFFYPIYLFVSH